jgi:hypothetical protein
VVPVAVVAAREALRSERRRQLLGLRRAGQIWAWTVGRVVGWWGASALQASLRASWERQQVFVLDRAGSIWAWRARVAVVPAWKQLVIEAQICNE